MYVFFQLYYISKYGWLIYRGDIIVDTFFVISGMLLCYHLLITLEERKKVSYATLIFLRYIR